MGRATATVAQYLVLALAVATAYLVWTAETEQTHYAMLKIGHDADQAEIKKAYRSRAMLLHPDKVGPQAVWEVWWYGDQVHRFNKLVVAHDCLIDPACRMEYDASLTAPPWAAQAAAASLQSSAENPRELALLLLGMVQGLMTDPYAWLALLSPRGLVRLVVFMLICALTLELARPLLALPARLARGLWGVLTCAKQRRNKEYDAAARATRVAAQRAAEILPPAGAEAEAAAQRALLQRKRKVNEALAAFWGAAGKPAQPAGEAAAREKAAELLEKLLGNLGREPGNPKFRGLRTTNEAVAKKLLPVPCAAEVLYAVGFEPDLDFSHLGVPEALAPAELGPAAAHAAAALARGRTRLGGGAPKVPHVLAQYEDPA
jgi:hypothetical protein